MSDVFVKATGQLLKSVNTPDYTDTSKYIINPKLPDCEPKYYKASGNKVVAMTKTEQTTKDTELQNIQKEFEREQLIAERREKILREQAIQELVSEGKITE
jgi:hypothetical protein